MYIYNTNYFDKYAESRNRNRSKRKAIKTSRKIISLLLIYTIEDCIVMAMVVLLGFVETMIDEGGLVRKCPEAV